MPMHDWKKVPDGIYHAFHHGWISAVGNLAAIPGAFLGLVLGVTLDAVAHRYQHRQPSQPAEPDKAIQPAGRFADDASSRLVESHGWDLSLGISPERQAGQRRQTRSSGSKTKETKI